LIGPGKAKEIIFADERINAQEAFRIGLVQRVVPKGQAVEEAKKLLKKIMGKGPVAVKMAKQAINEGCRCPCAKGWTSKLEATAYALGQKIRMKGPRPS